MNPPQGKVQKAVEANGELQNPAMGWGPNRHDGNVQGIRGSFEEPAYAIVSS